MCNRTSPPQMLGLLEIGRHHHAWLLKPFGGERVLALNSGSHAY
jgi:hypothetical protein